jgi:hypothetical protein
MPDTTIISATSGWTIFDTFQQGANIYNGTAALVALGGTWPLGSKIARAEIGTTGEYGPPTLTSLPAGTYTRKVRRSVGDTPATDPVLYIDSEFRWNGTSAVTVTLPTDPARTTAFLTVYDKLGNPAGGVEIRIKLLQTLAHSAGVSLAIDERTETSVAGTGLVQFTDLLRNAVYRVFRGESYIDFTTANAETSPIPELLGKAA